MSNLLGTLFFANLVTCSEKDSSNSKYNQLTEQLLHALIANYGLSPLKNSTNLLEEKNHKTSYMYYNSNTCANYASTCIGINVLEKSLILQVATKKYDFASCFKVA